MNFAIHKLTGKRIIIDETPDLEDYRFDEFYCADCGVEVKLQSIGKSYSPYFGAVRPNSHANFCHHQNVLTHSQKVSGENFDIDTFYLNLVHQTITDKKENIYRENSIRSPKKYTSVEITNLRLLHDYCLRNDLNTELGNKLIKDCIIDNRIIDLVDFNGFIGLNGLKLAIGHTVLWSLSKEDALVLETKKKKCYVKLNFLRKTDYLSFDAIFSERLMKNRGMPLACLGNFYIDTLSFDHETHVCIACDIVNSNQILSLK